MLRDELINTSEIIGSDWKMDKPFMIDELHEHIVINDELGLLSPRVFEGSLSFETVSGKLMMYSSGDRIRLWCNDENRLEFMLNSIPITGNKKTIIIKKMIETLGYIDTYYDDLSGWESFVVIYANTVYRLSIGTIDGRVLSSIKEYYPRNGQPTSKEYYAEWHKKNNRDHTYKEMGNIELKSEAYGDAESGLGSIITDQVENELLEAMKVIEQYQNTYYGKAIIDEIVEMAR